MIWWSENSEPWWMSEIMSESSAVIILSKVFLKSVSGEVLHGCGVLDFQWCPQKWWCLGSQDHWCGCLDHPWEGCHL